ncbi:MAG: hypothetical protein N2V78_07255 [Methanophagales archaeon]|nr:hypothetical protein [Methanophagales archaeon]
MTLAKVGDLKRRDEVVNGKVRKKIILKNYFILARYRVKKIAIFGSYARGEGDIGMNNIREATKRLSEEIRKKYQDMPWKKIAGC